MYAFNKIKGNDFLLQTLQYAIQRQKTPHAMIFAGPEGSGKQLIANTLAKALLCQSDKDKPCGHCNSCIRFESGNHPCVYDVAPIAAKSIGIDDIRNQITEHMVTKPFEFSYKIFVVHQAETLTPAAQNALLKTIEEPADYGVFMLLSVHTHSLLPTILSRCVSYKTRPLQNHQVAAYLSARHLTDEQSAASYAAYAQGNIGRAIALLENTQFSEMRTFLMQLCVKIRENNPLDAFTIQKQLEPYKENILEALDILYYWYHDILIFLETEDESYVTQKDWIDFIRQESQYYCAATLCNALNALIEAKSRLHLHANFQLTLEVMLLKIMGCYQKITQNNPVHFFIHEI